MIWLEIDVLSGLKRWTNPAKTRYYCLGWRVCRFRRWCSVKDHDLIHFRVETYQAHDYLDGSEFQKDKNWPQRRRRYFHKCLYRWIASSPALLEWSASRLNSCGLWRPRSLFWPPYDVPHMTLCDFAHQALPLFSVQQWKAGWSLGTRLCQLYIMIFNTSQYILNLSQPLDSWSR